MSTATESMSEEQAALKVVVPLELRTGIKIRAAETGVTMKEYVAEMLRRDLEGEAYGTTEMGSR